MLSEENMQELLDECKKYKSCMYLRVCEDSRAVELILTSDHDLDYSDPIRGEGADIGLMREKGTDRVIGVRLPLLNRRLAVQYDGPVRINSGFRKDEED